MDDSRPRDPRQDASVEGRERFARELAGLGWSSPQPVVPAWRGDARALIAAARARLREARAERPRDEALWSTEADDAAEWSGDPDAYTRLAGEPEAAPWRLTRAEIERRAAAEPGNATWRRLLEEVRKHERQTE